MSKENDKKATSGPQVFEHQSLQSLDAVLDYLDTIRDGFQQGQLTLSQEDGEVTLTPKGLTRVKIKAKQAKQHQEIRISLAWVPKDSSDDKDKPSALALSTKSSKKHKGKSKKTTKTQDAS